MKRRTRALLLDMMVHRDHRFNAPIYVSMVHIYATMLSAAAAEFRIDLFDVCLCLIICANTFVHMQEAHNMNLYMNIHGAYVADNYAQELACVRVFTANVFGCSCACECLHRIDQFEQK